MEDKIECALKESEMKQCRLSKAYGCLHAQATSIAVFSVQWKELQDHLESTRQSIEARFWEVKNREEEVRVHNEQLEIKESMLSSHMEPKFNELSVLEELIGEKIPEIVESRNSLRSLESLLKEHSDEVDVKEKRLVEVENFVREKKRELNEILGSIEASKGEFDLREEELKSMLRLIEECGKEFEVKEEKLSLIQELLVECSNELESREELIREVDLKERDVFSREKLHSATYDPGFQPQQQRENKYPRTSESVVPPYSVPPYNPVYHPPSKSSVTHYQVPNYTPVGYPQPGPPPPSWHYKNGHLGQFGKANFGPNLVIHYRPHPYFPGPPPPPPPAAVRYPSLI